MCTPLPCRHEEERGTKKYGSAELAALEGGRYEARYGDGPGLVIHASKKGCSRTRRKGGVRLGPEVSAVAQKRVEELSAQAKSLSAGSE